MKNNPDRFFNRELSWLEFNSRVLAQAEDTSLPLLERAKFLAIWGTNLDEFFQVRVAQLREKVANNRSPMTPDGRTPTQLLAEIRIGVAAQSKRMTAAYKQVVGALEGAGIAVVDWDALDKSERKFLLNDFEQRIFPVLTPLAVDPGHPFPYISNLSLSLGVLLRDPSTAHLRFARLKVPDFLGRFVALPTEGRFIAIEDVVFAHADHLFPGLDVAEKIAFRVTRNSDIEIDGDEVLDLLSAVEKELSQRRFQRVVRLEVNKGASKAARDLLMNELEIGSDDVYVSRAPLNLGALWELYSVDHPVLKGRTMQPVTPREFRAQEDAPPDIFAAMRKKDLLVRHPYESFSGTVQEFLAQASIDPQVQAIKMTLYRTSGDSPILEHLIRAAEEGKQVAVVVELQARFDEAANVRWARQLEEAGVHVSYGLAGLKVHAKILLVVRAEDSGVRRYCHVGTGNYNSLTARIYTDLGLFTTDPGIGADLSQLFNSLTGYGRPLMYERLVVAPEHLRDRLVELMRNEAQYGSKGRVTAKVNALVDPDMIDVLYEVSQAGTHVDLLVRGSCCLRPGVPGMSENIRVRGIIGAFLEHSRIYRFANGNGPGEPLLLIGSADLMQRNLDRRVEVLVPVDEPHVREMVDQLLDLELADEKGAWTLWSDGQWTPVQGDPAKDVQAQLEEAVR